VLRESETPPDYGGETPVLRDAEALPACTDVAGKTSAPREGDTPNGRGEADAERMLAGAEGYRAAMATRRSVRGFLPKPVPREVVEAAIRAAASAPSGANKQPWSFVAVSDPDIKRAIRDHAEAEERAFYAGRAPEDWIEDLKPLGTTWRKPFLEDAPWLIVVFAQPYGIGPEGRRERHYYVRESVGIAVGFLLSALHYAGLATLTYTPARMGFLRDLLQRPEHERPFMVVVTGHADPATPVPAIERKSFDRVAEFR